MAVTRIKNNQITDSTVVASAKLVSGSVTGGLLSNPLNYSGDFTISGNLTVNGTTTTVDTTNTLVADPVIVLSRGESGTPSNDAGFLVERGTSQNAAWLWDETNDRFEGILTTADGLTGGTITAASYANLKVNDLEATTISMGNIDIAGNTISSTDANGNINLSPNGSGEVVAATLAVTDLTSGRVVYVSTNDALVDSSNFTYDGTTLTVTGTSNVTGQLNVDNIRIDGTVISTFASNDNITITPNGTGNLIITTATANRVFYAGTNKEQLTSANFTFNGTDVTMGGDLAVNGGNITTSSATFTVANANATTINFGGAATTVNIGAATGTTIIKNNLDVDGDLNVDGGDITVTTATTNIANANATTINFGGAATTVNIGAASGTTIIKNSLDVDGDINVDGGDITFSGATANIANATVTTVNFGGAATSISIGSATGSTTVNNNMTVAGNLTVQGTTTTVDSTVTTVVDPIFTIGGASGGGAPAADDNKDRGIAFQWHDGVGARVGFFGYDDSASAFTFIPNATIASEVVSGTAGNLILGGGTFGNIQITGNTISSTDTNGNVNITPNGSGDVVLSADSVVVGDSNTQAVVTTNGTGNLLLNTNSGTNSGSITIVQGASGNINLTPNGSGEVVASTLAVGDLTNTRITYAGANGALTDNANLTFSGTLLTVTGNANVSTTANVGNIQITANTISSLNTNGNINITPNGTGEVIASTLAVTDLTSNRVVYVGTNDALVDSANMTFDGSTLVVTGTSNVAGQLNVDNIQIDGNTISSTNTNGNINLAPNGTGYTIINSGASSTDFIVNGNTTVSASYANIFYVKASTGQIGIGTNSPAPNVLVDMDAFTTSVILPKGTTGQRPSGDEVEGMLRYNTSTHFYEFWDGNSWESTTANFTTIAADSFSGDGTTLSFTLSQTATAAGIIVSINGVMQIPGTAYGVSGTTLTFTEAPQVGDNIDVRIITTTTTVTGISDLNTEITIDDLNELANVKIDGDLILQVSNAAVYPGSNGTINLGKATTGRWNTVYATNTSIQNADLAECYLADSYIPPGTVVCFGGNEEVTICMTDMDTKVAGVVSTHPAHVMNSMLEGEHVIELALQGRVPCRVYGPVRKGDMMVSAGNGMARAEENPKLGSVIGKALENFDNPEGVIEIVVGRV